MGSRNLLVNADQSMWLVQNDVNHSLNGHEDTEAIFVLCVIARNPTEPGRSH